MKELILITLFGCHFLADYTPLSRPWMLSAKRLGTPLFPIFCHACVHGVLMTIVLLLIGIKMEVVLAMNTFQIGMHFWIDVLKGKMNYWFPSLQSPADTWHWVVFGFDQYLHALTIIIMTYEITK